MRISIFGLGYVGAVSAACFAARGHDVIGVDANPAKVDLLKAGKPSFIEPGLGPLLAEAVSSGRLTATMDPTEAIHRSDLTFICVGTPSTASGSIDLGAVRTVCAQIGAALTSKSSAHLVVMRSTVLPGTLRDVVAPALETHSGRRQGEGFHVASNPEFLREGSAIADFDNPRKTVIGTISQSGASILTELYTGFPGSLVITTPETAELTKYVDNPWHALKVAFANEIGNISKAVGVDSREIMKIFCMDDALNISSAYLRPGFAFGGSCLPKDLRAINYLARNLDLDLPVLQATIASNKAQVDRAFDLISTFGTRRAGVLGCSFKPNTDDVRESPFVELIERMIGKGYQVSIFDPNVRLSAMMGANREYMLRKLPHISSLLAPSAGEAVQSAEIVLLTTLAPEYVSAIPGLRSDQILLDFAGLGDRQRVRARYHGINW